jgi:hypothetical protein
MIVVGCVWNLREAHVEVVSKLSDYWLCNWLNFWQWQHDVCFYCNIQNSAMAFLASDPMAARALSPMPSVRR